MDAATLLRARGGLNTPDALQAVSALVATERPVFVTADAGFAKVSGLESKRAANPSRLGESDQVVVGASQRCGSNSSKRELGQVGNLVSTSFR